MRRPMWVLLVIAACTPLIFVVMLFVAAHLPLLDRVTARLPAGIRAAVGELALLGAGGGKDSSQVFARVARIDPENPQVLTRLCRETVKGDPGYTLATCQRAAAMEHSERNLNQLGLAQEKGNDFCAAEESFTQANSMVNAHDADVLRNLGRAAMKCGHTGASVASFEVAEEVDAKDDDDEEGSDLLLDRDWLIMAYAANHEARASAVMCMKAHPTWKGCQCVADGLGVKCSST